MIGLIILGAIIINVIIANVIGKIGNDKKIGYTTSFCVSFLLSPIVGLLLVIASIPLTDEEKKNQQRVGEKLTNDDFYGNQNVTLFSKNPKKTERIYTLVISIVVISWLIFVFL